MKKVESGTRRSFWLPKNLDAKVEEARQILGLGKSGFYRYAVVKLLESLVSQQNKTNQKAGTHNTGEVDQ